MKIVLNFLLLLVSAGLVYLLVETIRKPIEFEETREAREEVVKARLLEIVDLQKMHKDIHQEYANNFDSLKYALLNDTFYVEMVIGDRYDTTQTVRKEIVAFPAKDSLLSYLEKKGKNQTVDAFFASLRKIPFSSNKEFYIKKGEAIVEGTDSLMAPTFEVGTTLSNYLEEFDSASYVIYDPNYDPEHQILRVGDLYKPSTAGNW